MSGQPRKAPLAEAATAFTFYRGRVALACLLEAMGIGPGAKVAIQAFTCLAVPEAVLAVGAIPVYVDIEPGGYNMAPESLERDLAQVDAVVVQHTFGIPADMNGIARLAQAAGTPVIEDCCHTFDSRIDGKPVGTFGKGAFFSFEWGKPIVAGIGGGLRVNDPALEDEVRRRYAAYRFPGLSRVLRVQAQYYLFSLLYRPSLYWPVRSAFHKLSSVGAAEGNYNPMSLAGDVASDFQLRMARPLRRRLAAKTRALPDVVEYSRSLCRRYCNEICTPTVTKPRIKKGVDPVFARYPLRVSGKASLLRQARQARVELAEWYATPIHPFEGDDLRRIHYEPGSCPEAEQRAMETVSLPTHRRVTSRDAEKAITFLNGVSWK